MREAAQQGTCRCGHVRFEVSGAPILTMACHCTGCQKMSSSAFSLSSAFPADQFRLVQGETVVGGVRGPTQHHFCPSCMSWLFTRPEGLDWLVNVRSTMLDDPASHRPYVEMYCDEGLAWVSSGAVRSYRSAPGEQEFPAIIAEFAEWRTKDERLEA